MTLEIVPETAPDSGLDSLTDRELLIRMNTMMDSILEVITDAKDQIVPLIDGIAASPVGRMLGIK